MYIFYTCVEIIFKISSSWLWGQKAVKGYQTRQKYSWSPLRSQYLIIKEIKMKCEKCKAFILSSSELIKNKILSLIDLIKNVFTLLHFI